ncbi:MAG: DUF349 domain-containing protein [Paludibacteraceae bacterium]|nr:DUF349 domain-containing protein [Paludibacteraceae bacterium]
MSEQRQALIEELQQLLEQEDVTAIKDQVEHIKTQFYRPVETAETPAEQPVETAEEIATEAPQTDPQEEQFKALLAQYKAKRAEVAAQTAKEQQENLSRKQAILSVMKTLAEGETDAVMSSLPRMRELQAEWKTIGPVPAANVQEIRKAYQQYQEQFYDMVKINIELRDLDFKKNLELKTLLCEAAERLQNNDNIVEASRALQQLHDEWAEIGPVARELREEIWERFKAASTAINKRHQAYFDELHAKEQDNLARKRAIIEQLQALNEALQNGEQKLNAKAWDKATEQVQALQNQWRTIGFAPKKFNQSIYEEYRAECDKFFRAKAQFFKGIRDVFSENLKHKRALIAQAKEVLALLEEKTAELTQQEWNEAADKLRALQAEWKTVGAVPRKVSDDLWKQFTEACDAFFNARREVAEKAKSQRQSQRSAQRREPAAGTNLYRLRDTLMQEIKVAENNILFFSGKSKTANKIVEDMQRKIDKLKAQLAEVKERIQAEDEE